MESYLQGVFQQEFNSDQKASEFYQAAVNKDKDFIQAWIQLADTNQRVGKSEQAISIAENTLIKFEKDLSIKQLIKLNYIMAYAYFYKGDNDKARSHLSQSISFINQTENPLVKLTAYDSLGGMAFMKQDWEKAEEYTLKRIAIAKDYYPFPNYIAAMDLILAEIYGSQAKLEKSKAHLYSAMEYYEKTNNSAGMIRAIVSMLTINLLQSQFDEGILLINKAESYLNDMNNPNYAFLFMSKATLILNLRGYFDRTDSYLKKMSQISSNNPTPFNESTIAYTNIHKYYVQNKFTKTKVYLSSLNKIYSSKKELSYLLPQYYLFDLLISARTESGETALKKYQDFLNKYPTLNDFDSSAFIDRSLGHINVSLGNISKGIEYFKTAIEINRNNKDWSAANYIGFELLEVMLKHPEIDYKKTLSEVSSYTKYDYFLFKLKAQFLARESNFFDAAIVMSENKQKANQLWNASDQLLLEEFQLKSKN
jgi:tetratricopeptide (TPR) repeat protein